MPALRIVLGYIFPTWFGSNFHSGQGGPDATPDSDATTLPTDTQMSTLTKPDLEIELMKRPVSGELSVGSSSKD
jgi:hypothetical protein